MTNLDNTLILHWDKRPYTSLGSASVGQHCRTPKPVKLSNNWKQRKLLRLSMTGSDCHSIRDGLVSRLIRPGVRLRRKPIPSSDLFFAKTKVLTVLLREII